MHDGNAQGETAAMQRTRGLAVPRREKIAIGNVDVLDVELDSPVSILLTELQQAAGGGTPGRCVGQQFSQRRLIESFVDDQWHDFHAVGFGEREHSRVELPENHAETVDSVDLRAEDGDLVDVLHQTLV